MRRFAVLFAMILAGSAAPALANEFVVHQKNMQFTPNELTVQKGDKVIFLNDDTRTHNVYSTSEGNAFDTKAERPGSQAEVVFANPGVVEIYCAIHAAMKMTIKVQ
jgi:plastocyanin